MRVLLVNGAYRRDGVTRELSDLFVTGCRAEGAVVDLVDLKDHKIKNCLGCFECYSAPTPGVCVQKDDMAGLIERFNKADGLVLASPVYFYSFSASMKVFLERLFPLTQPKHMPNSDDGLVYNAMRNPDLGPKTAVLIAPFAQRQIETALGFVDTFEKISRGLGASPVGRLLRPESNFMDFEASRPMTLKKIRSAFEESGRAYARQRLVPKELEAQACIPLSMNPQMYAHHCDTFWEILAESSVKGGDREGIRRVIAEDLRILMPELASRIDSRAADGVSATILFDLEGNTDKVWHLVISDGECEAREGFIENPDLRIKSSLETITDMIMRRIDIREALTRKEIELKGDKNLFTRFGRMFPPRSV